MKAKIFTVFVLLISGISVVAKAVPRTSGASFLNIPTGAEPAALGAAYSALATDVYATTWNPGGLGHVETTQIGVQHLSYLESLHYEFLGFVQPLQPGHAFGVSVQLLDAGDIASTDVSGNSIGSFSSRSGAYSIAYGQSVTEQLSLGITGKVFESKIDNVNANAYAGDLGIMCKAIPKLMLAGVLANVGTKLTFLNQSDSLPIALHLGGAYQATPRLTLALEGVIPKAGQFGFHSGIDWRLVDALSLRVGYRTDTTQGLSSLAGLTMGVGFKIFNQMLSYSWVPLDDLGNTQYFSLIINFPSSRK